MERRFFSTALALSFVLLAFSSCVKDDDPIAPPPQILEINEFIWEHMNNIYLWKDNIPQNIDREREFDPEELFEKMLFRPTDRWSFITDDYEELVNSLKGIEKSYGHHFKLFRLQNSNNIAGIVKYVIPASPADFAGMKRGDVFYKVNGIGLNTENYYELLFESDTYKLSFGQFDNTGEIALVEEKTLSAVVIAENPISIDKVIEFDGAKIGYLSYNQFIRDYNDQLISTFNEFKNFGIQDLVLDLRYNPGGSIGAAILLSSMIVPARVANNQDVYSRLIWNEDIMDYLLEEEGEESINLVSRFVTPEVNLNLDRVYVLITKNSASASELLINCLRPYMEVILIGPENTTGKYVGSITIDDEEADHGWALQPIVLKTANANGNSDYVDGFSPDYYIEDDFNAQLGTLEEDLLAKSIELITGQSVTEPARIASSNIPSQLQPVTNIHEVRRQNMYLDLQ
jgi:C-terminal processing protease CtpA/Prc